MTPRIPDAERPASDQDVDSTTALLERARGGDREALDQLFARHLPLLHRWATGRLPGWARDISDTNDLVQDTVFQTLRRIDTFDPRGAGALQAYLRHALMNRIRSEFRRQGRRPVVDVLDSGLADFAASPLEQALEREDLDHLDRALDRLSPQDRDLVISRIELDLSYREIARVFAKPSADAARKAVVRAVMRLSEEMTRLRG